MELGGAPSGDQKASSEPKEPASKEQPTSSDPEPKKEELKPEPSQEKKPEVKKEAPPPKKTEPKADSKSASSRPTLGSREERRVCSTSSSPLYTTDKVSRLR